MAKVTIELDGFTIDYNELHTQFKNELKKLVNEKRNMIQELLDLSIKTRTLITLASDQMRGIGKTTMVINKSHELNLPIVTTDTTYYVLLKQLGAKSVYCFNNTHEARGIRFKDGFLVDEGTNDLVVKDLVKNNNILIGGFKRL